MNAKYSCPHCGQAAPVTDASAGATIICPHCHQSYLLKNDPGMRDRLASPKTWAIAVALAIGVTSPVIYTLLKPDAGRSNPAQPTPAGENVKLNPGDPALASKVLAGWLTDLESFDPATSRKARGFLQSNAKVAKPLLVSAIRGDRDSALRRIQAPQALGLIIKADDPEFQILLNALNDGDPLVRSAAMSALRKNNLNPSFVVRYLVGMGASTNGGTRLVAAQFLGDWGGIFPDALAALEKLATDSESSVRGVAKKSLIKSAPPDLTFSDGQLTSALRDLPSGDPGIRKSARDRIGAIGRAAVPELIAAMDDKKSNSRDRALAAQALGYAGRNQEPEVPALLNALKDSDPVVREYAAASLGLLNLDPAVFVPLCIDLFSDRSTRVRRRAAENLSRIGPAANSAIPVLQKVADSDTDEATRIAAGSALKKITLTPSASKGR